LNLVRFTLLTTCNALVWQQYGHRMVETSDQFRPNEIPHCIYADDFSPIIRDRCHFGSLSSKPCIDCGRGRTHQTLMTVRAKEGQESEYIK
jgi:hypothetical protein